MSELPGLEASAIFFLVADSAMTASATALPLKSQIASTPSVSHHLRAMLEATSALSWLSAKMTSAGAPSTGPASAPAILTAATRPAPVWSEYVEDMSVSTPSFTGPPCAHTRPVGSPAVRTALAAK